MFTSTTTTTTLLLLFTIINTITITTHAYSTSDSTSSPDSLLATAHNFAYPILETSPSPSTLKDALSEIDNLREVLRHLLSTKEYKAPPPPLFLQQEREKQAKVQEEEKKDLARLQQQYEVNAGGDVAAASEVLTSSVSCNHHVSCDACLEAKCGWCIGARRCIEDIAWVCRGDHDHVGKVGKHSTCPTLESVEEARRERDILRETARLAHTPSSSSKKGEREGEGEGGTTTTTTTTSVLPFGTYEESCRDCILHDDKAAAAAGAATQPSATQSPSTILRCMCQCPDGVERPVELDPSTCDKNTQEIINSNGQLICSDMSVTRVEATRRAVERLKQREAEELERISNEMKDEAKTKKENEGEETSEASSTTTKKKKKKTKQQREQDQHQRETIGRFIKRSLNDETRAAKAPYESLEVERTGELLLLLKSCC